MAYCLVEAGVCQLEQIDGSGNIWAPGTTSYHDAPSASDLVEKLFQVGQSRVIKIIMHSFNSGEFTYKPDALQGMAALRAAIQSA